MTLDAPEGLTKLAVSGPITGGSRGWPFGRPLADLDACDYVEEEWFLEGEAVRYRLEGEMTKDGRWSATPNETAPFKTRAVVYRPSDPAKASGVAVLCWNNVSAGYDLFNESPEIFSSGHSLVAVTTQKVGIEGLESSRKGLVDWDPERYGDLRHPGDDWSYDIFTQAARAVRAGELGDLRADVVIAMGASQSAARVATYANALHALTRVFDAYFLQIWFGRGTSLEVGSAVLDLSKASSGTEREFFEGKHQIRTDLDVPVFVVNSELEAGPCFYIRQDDTDRFRYWEAAATSHVSWQINSQRAKKHLRDFGTEQPVSRRMNRVPLNPVYDAALHHLVRWVTDGTPPPIQPRLEFTGDPPEVVRDEHGIAQGGIRLPQAEVPIATNSAIPASDNVFLLLNGSSVPFDPTTVRELYGTREEFLARFEKAAHAARAAGVLLDRDVETLLAEASEQWPEEIGGDRP